jgi:hypothetical protein
MPYGSLRAAVNPPMVAGPVPSPPRGGWQDASDKFRRLRRSH